MNAFLEWIKDHTDVYITLSNEPIFERDSKAYGLVIKMQFKGSSKARTMKRIYYPVDEFSINGNDVFIFWLDKMYDCLLNGYKDDYLEFKF